MANNGQRPPWETSKWRTFHEPPPDVPKEKSIGVLGVLAIAVGVGVFGYYMLDGHTHTCEACGNRWRHLGAFNFGEVNAHTCKSCGTVQWWKDGFQHVFRDPSNEAYYEASPATAALAARLQEIRELPQAALPFGTPPAGPRGSLR